MGKTLLLYHGSTQIVREPLYGAGKMTNDFGQGFYCTENLELAKEWSVNSIQSGFANRYALESENLRILNLNSPEYTILNWIAVLLEHRIFPVRVPVARKAKYYLIEKFGINVNAYDVIIGYRADDSYYDFASDFLNNGITVEQLSKAMRLGKLGEQIVLKSPFSFSCLRFEGFDFADKESYFVKRKARDDEATRQYSIVQKQEYDGLFVMDIIRGGITNDDPRIPRNIPE